MFLKVIRPDDCVKESIFECRRIHLLRLPDVGDQAFTIDLEGPGPNEGIRLNIDRANPDEKNIRLYLMNDEGKTIDSF